MRTWASFNRVEYVGRDAKKIETKEKQESKRITKGLGEEDFNMRYFICLVPGLKDARKNLGTNFVPRFTYSKVKS